MFAFAVSGGVGVLITARVLQGVATGIAMGAVSAALLDLQPPSRPHLGALMGVVGPLSGLAMGALVTGLLVDYGPAPTKLVFWLLLGVFATATAAAAVIPETVRADGAWRHSLRSRIGVPPPMRAAFAAALPCLAATWALGGLILALGPSITATVFGDESHLAGGLPIFLMAGISAVASVRVRDVNARLPALLAGFACLRCGGVAGAGGGGRGVRRWVPARRPPPPPARVGSLGFFPPPPPPPRGAGGRWCRRWPCPRPPSPSRPPPWPPVSPGSGWAWGGGWAPRPPWRRRRPRWSCRPAPGRGGGEEGVLPGA